MRHTAALAGSNGRGHHVSERAGAANPGVLDPPPPTGGGPAPGGSGGGGGLVRMTVNLTPRAHRDLLKVSQATGLSRTDAMNRAVQVYALIEELLSREGGALTIKRRDGTEERIYIL